MKNSKQLQDKLWAFTKVFVAMLVIITVLRFFLFIPLRVDGDSMSPNLKPEDYLIYGRFARINRFDIILFKSEDDETLIKRVVGVPGDRIVYFENKLYVNHNQVNEYFLSQNEVDGEQITTANFTLEELTGESRVPADAYFVLGDNRNRSNDSRMFGFVSRDQVLGKAFMIYFPFADFGWLN